MGVTNNELAWDIKYSELGWLLDAARHNDRQINDGLKDGESLLHIAARNDSEEMCRALISTGYNVNAVDNYGHTPLYGAIKHGHIGVIEILLDSGSNPNHKDKNGNSPLHKAIVTRLDAPHNLNIKIMELLLKSGADINQVNKFNETPLMYCFPSVFDLNRRSGCFKYGMTKMAKFLIDNGGMLEND